MSRKIKFRAWDKKSKQLCPISNLDLDGYETRVVVTNREGRQEGYLRSFKDIELMQFTGLLDKNGKEIYEGDVVTCDEYPFVDEGKPNYNATVEWIFSQWQIVLHCVSPEKGGISNGINEGLNPNGIAEGENCSLEVIGNIYENPELLKS